MSERGDRFAWRARIWLVVIASARPVSLTHRSFDYSESICGSSAPFRSAHRLFDTRNGAVSASSSRRRRFRYSNSLRSCVPLPSSSDTGDGAMMFSSCQSADGINGGLSRSISGGLLFRYDSALVRPSRSVKLIRSSDTRNGTGDCCLPSSRCSFVSRNYPWCSGW